MDFEKAACAHVRALTPYQSARRIGGHGHTFLNANEYYKSETYFFNSTTLNRYPDCQPFELLALAADYVGKRPENILVSRGSDEAIGLIIRTFCEEGEGIVIAPPTYGMYAIAAQTNRARVACAQRESDFSLTAEAVIRAVQEADFKVKAVFIDTPGNPLGGIFAKEELLKLCAELPETLIVMDEAYIEFCPEHSCVPLIKDHPNIVVLHTLSKAFALAGIRCGYTIADPQVISYLLKIIDPYPVPDPVFQIARQALSRGGIAMMRERVETVVRRREELATHLQALPCVKEIFPSKANYLLVRFHDGEKIFHEMAQRGIILRSFVDKPGLQDCLRITIGSPEELDEVMRTLTALQQN